MAVLIECAECHRDFDPSIAPSCPFCDGQTRTRADVERDMRDWEANEHELPANERFTRGAR